MGVSGRYLVPKVCVKHLHEVKATFRNQPTTCLSRYISLVFKSYAQIVEGW